MRATKPELAKRINAAYSLLKKNVSKEKILSVLTQQFGVSRKQAYRYLEHAQKQSNLLPIPEQKVVFTVKLPVSVVLQLKKSSEATGKSLSDLVAQSLEKFLKSSGYVNEQGQKEDLFRIHF